ncbi:hypothetical protein RAE21_16010 [Rhodoferax sp. TBRC 17198]|uniref:hypothetical protein n=1 Tax=Rhodoferax potami TaxID=3068338 RepID=UPI0028BE6E95|nr:hypothetical protein [Rhodoferax sp. TBRC 17198]MDT7523892.1 hypothetical protein [Rhodoferax sp. TBRC 17198]
MAAGTIITVLSNVPWGQVIDAAPKVAEGATKLWSAVTRRKKSDAEVAPQAGAGATGGVVPDDSLQRLRADVQVLQASVGEVREELLSATGLIKQLADQNTVLVQRVELHRRRLALVSYLTAGAVTMLVLAVVYLLTTR